MSKIITRQMRIFGNRSRIPRSRYRRKRRETRYEKTIAVKNFPTPKSQTNIGQFLGLAEYYRRFIEGFSATARPLSGLLKKNTPYVWKDEHQKSFDSLNEALCTTPVLRHPDF